MDSRKRTLDNPDSTTRTTGKRRWQDFNPSASPSVVREANRHANKPRSENQYSNIIQQAKPKPGSGPSTQPLAHPIPIPAQRSTLLGAVPLQSMQVVSDQARTFTRHSTEGWKFELTTGSESASGAGGHRTSRHNENIASPRAAMIMGPPMSTTAHRRSSSTADQYSGYGMENIRLQHAYVTQARAWARWIVKTANPMDFADMLAQSCSKQDLERRFNALHGDLNRVVVADDKEYASPSIEERITFSMWWF